MPFFNASFREFEIISRLMVILITGITSGFGKAAALRLSQEGHIVYGTHRRETDELPLVRYLRCDVTDEASVKEAVGMVMSEQGRIDVLINNAGCGIGGPLEMCGIEDARSQMDVNWLGMVRVLHYVLPVMRAQGGGRIIAVSSIGGLIGLPFQGLYSASKFAVEGYCEALRMEVKDLGIKVTVVEPGDFHTDFTARRKSVDPESAASAYPSYRRSLEEIRRNELSGLRPEVLAAKVSKIISMRNPGDSYIVATFLQRLSVVAKRLLPAKLFDWIIRKYYRVG